MRSLSVSALAAVSTIALTHVALAADLPRKAPVAPPSPSPVYSWTGFYVGANAGGGWGARDKAFLGLPDNGVIWPNYNPVVNGLADPDVSGFVGGLQVGYNYQINWAVLGIEADIDYSAIRGSRSTATTSLGGTAFTFDESHKLKWLSTIRGRLGWLATPSALIFFTGGLAVGGVEEFTSLTFALPPNFSYNGTTSDTKAGWTIGGGAELALARNWSVKVEYLYYDLGTVRVIGVPNPGVAGISTQTDFKIAGNIARVGVNYRF